MRFMSFMVKGLGSLFVVLLFVASTSAQTLDPPVAVSKIPADLESTRVLLQSSDPREQAWGAWVAQRDRRAELASSLQAVVARHVTGQGRADQAALDAGLDALIQLGGGVDPAWALSLYERRPAAAVVLLSLDGRQADAALIALARPHVGLTWFAAANLLLSHRVPGAAALFLTGLRLTGTICLVEADKPRGCGGGDGGSVTVGDGGPGLSPGFPPAAAYALAPESPEPGLVLVSSGPTSVYYRRSVSRAGETSVVSVVDYPDRPNATDRLAYVAALLQTEASRLPLKGSEWCAIRRDDDVEAAKVEFRQDVLQRYDRLVDQLVSAKLLSRDDLPARPSVEIAVR